ncbi:MAG: hypothetical protein ACWA5K_09810 [bacterium]
MRKPYRIVVWGPGTLGNIAIREVVRMKEFELVGVRAYSPEKQGLDAGSCAGIGEVGIKISTDEAEVLAIDCDAIIHTARDQGNYAANDEILRLIQAGKNVITILPYQDLDHVGELCPADFKEQLITACQQSGAVFHSTGIHPEFIAERMIASATGICTDIQQIKMAENWDLSHMTRETLMVAGYGLPVEEAKQQKVTENLTNNYCLQNLHGLASCVGVTLDRVEVERGYIPAPEDLPFKEWTVKQGCVARLSHRFKGYADRINSSEPFIIVEINWMMGHGPMLPEGIRPEDIYVMTIKGTPDVRMCMDIKADLDTGRRLVKEDDPTSEAGFYGVIATALQSVPFVCAAEAGVLPVYRPSIHWAPDFRELAD